MGSCSSKPKTSEFDGGMEQILESNKPAAGEPMCKDLHSQKRTSPQLVPRSADKDRKVLPSPEEVEKGASTDLHDEVLISAKIPISGFISLEHIGKLEKLCEAFPDTDDVIAQKETVVVEATVIEAPEFVKEMIASSQKDACKEQPAELNLQKPETTVEAADPIAVESAEQASNEEKEVEKSQHVVCEETLRHVGDANLLLDAENAEAQIYQKQGPNGSVGSGGKFSTNEDEVGLGENGDACCLSAGKGSGDGLQNVSIEENAVKVLKAYGHGSFASSYRYNLCNNELKQKQGNFPPESNILQELVKEMSTVKKPPEANIRETRDIDEVLEKLASEFERQESLSLSSRS